jgi:hypothetical protein
MINMVNNAILGLILGFVIMIGSNTKAILTKVKAMEAQIQKIEEKH